MKKLLLMFAAVGMLFTACNKETDHNNDKHDHSADLVGTWTCITENYAEALIINADGTAVSYGVEDGEYWENVSGSVIVDGDNITMNFEDNDNLTGHFDIIPNREFSLYEDSGERYVYQYCANDLADEIVGQWVCYDGPTNTERDMLVQTYQNDGYTIKTGWSDAVNDFIVNNKTTYKVVGDLIFYARPTEFIPEEMDKYVACRIDYIPNGLSYGDKKTITGYIPVGEDQVKVSGSWLRIKQSLDLTNKNYDYSNIYVTNVKGADKEFEFAGQTLNFSTLDGSVMDKLMKHILFNVSFADNKIYYNCYFDGENHSIDAPIVVEGNKVTIEMSKKNSVYRDIEVYMFQDQDNTQMHMYMPVKSFEKFFGNITAVVLAKNNELNLEDANAVAEHYAKIEAAIETINVSFVFKAAK